MLVRVIEVVGITVIVLGAVIALFRFGRESWPGATGDRGVHGLRSDLGKAILLGLEFLVAADIINTVAIEPTLQSVAVLAGIVRSEERRVGKEWVSQWRSRWSAYH